MSKQTSPSWSFSVIEMKSEVAFMSKHSSHLSTTSSSHNSGQSYSGNDAAVCHIAFSYTFPRPDELYILLHGHLSVQKGGLHLCNKCLHCVFIFYCPCGLQDRRFSDEIDKLTGYKTKSLLCMPIRNSDGEIIGVAQAINKSSSGELFTEDDEKVISLS